MKPSLEEARKFIYEGGVDAAIKILNERGISFYMVADRNEAKSIYQADVTRFLAENDIEGAGACLMQSVHLLLEEQQELFVQLAAALYQKGDNLFYGDGDMEAALRCFQLSSGLAPSDVKALRGVISVCLQGHTSRPELALPYAVIQAHLNPQRDEVDYILRLISGETKNPLSDIPTTEKMSHIINILNPSEEDINNINYWNARIEMDTDDADAYIGRANCHGRKGNDSDAFSDFEHALAIDSLNISAYINRGYLYAILEDFNNALEDFNSAIQIDPNSPEAFRYRGTCLARIGKHSEALDDFDRLVKLGKIQASDQYSRGNVLAKLNRPEEAVSAYEQAIDLDPGDPLAYVNLGGFYYNTGRYKEALPYYEKAASLGHAEGELIAHNIRRRIGLIDEAVETLLAANSKQDIEFATDKFSFMLGAAFLRMITEWLDKKEDSEFKDAVKARIDILNALVGK